MKTIGLQCVTCGNDFVKELREYKRQVKNGRIEFFCTRTCAAIKNNQDNPRKGNIFHFGDKRTVKQKDEYSPFRWFLTRARFRSKKKHRQYDITKEYLKELWEKQNGICPFTNWKLILPQDNSYPWDNKNPANASLDRIDNSIGYMQDNVRFVSVMANLARQSFTDEQLVDFCKAVTASYQRN